MMNIQRVNKRLKNSDLVPGFVLGLTVMIVVAYAAERILKETPRDSMHAAVMRNGQR
jgi:hypothetical protein